MTIKLNKLRVSGFISLVLILVFLSNLPATADSRIPPGSYKDTCRDIRPLGDILIAQCENEKGVWVGTKLNISFCEGDIRNENGALKCKQKPAPEPPSGSYKESCKDIRVAGNELRASCKKRNGKWRNARIKYKKCHRDIWNNNGELTCGKKNGSNVPGGSYKSSCSDYYVEGKRLYANCEKRNGRMNKTSINYKNCRGDISNNNGELVCGNNNQGNLPKGSYKNSCKNIYKEGNVLEADCKNKNGKWKHSSIKFKNCNKGLWNDNGRLRCN